MVMYSLNSDTFGLNKAQFWGLFEINIVAMSGLNSQLVLTSLN